MNFLMGNGKSKPIFPSGSPGNRWQEQGWGCWDKRKRLRCRERKVGGWREQQQTRGETTQAEGLGTKLDGLRALGWRGKSNMVINQNVWAGEWVPSTGKEPEKNELHHVASSVWNSVLVADRPKSWELSLKAANFSAFCIAVTEKIDSDKYSFYKN